MSNHNCQPYLLCLNFENPTFLQTAKYGEPVVGGALYCTLFSLRVLTSSLSFSSGSIISSTSIYKSDQKKLQHGTFIQIF